MINNKKERLEAIENRANEIRIKREVKQIQLSILIQKGLIRANELEVKFI